MLTIRLQRTGKKNQADFRIVLAEKEAPVKKKFVEILGSYNPRKKDFRAKADRVKYWIDQRVDMSPTVHNLFVTNGLLDGKKVKAFNTPKKSASAEATADKPAAEAAPAEVAAEAAAPVETPAEVAEATAEVETKVEGETTPEEPKA